jgi:3-hydroxyisobutyrate dehydrogenase
MGAQIRSLALLGTGIMGAAMGRNLLQAGFELRAWNRSRDKAEPLAERGAVLAQTPAEAVGGADAVITMLADGDAVREVASGEQGVLAAIGDEATWLQMSTVGLAATAELADAAAEAEVEFVDAPVLGTKQPAEEGKLIVLASGPQAALARAHPVFEAVAAKVAELGAAGAGSRMKVVVNSWILTLTAGLAETLTLAEALELEGREFLELIAGGPLDVAYAQTKGDSMLEGQYPSSFPLRLAAKDAALVREAATAERLDLELAAAVERRFAAAEELGHGDADMAAVYEAVSPRRRRRGSAAS